MVPHHLGDSVNVDVRAAEQFFGPADTHLIDIVGQGNIGGGADGAQIVRGIKAEECAFWGDEFVGIEEGIFGSDSFMMTERTREGDFFDVSEVPGKRPEGVMQLGGGVERFLAFLRREAQDRNSTVRNREAQ